MRFSSVLVLAFLLGACGDDVNPAPADAGSVVDAAVQSDAGVMADAAVESDAGSAEDAGREDAGMAVMDGGMELDGGAEMDAGSEVDAGAATDAGAEVDAGPMDAGALCHDYTFGRGTVAFEHFRSLPPLRGGTLVDGVYDAVSARTTTSVSGTYRGTWAVVDGHVHTLVQLTLSGSPSEPQPRSYSYELSGTHLLRTVTCNDDRNYDNEYNVETVGEDTFLTVGSSSLQFRMQRRR